MIYKSFQDSQSQEEGNWKKQENQRNEWNGNVNLENGQLKLRLLVSLGDMAGLVPDHHRDKASVSITGVMIFLIMVEGLAFNL